MNDNNSLYSAEEQPITTKAVKPAKVSTQQTDVETPLSRLKSVIAKRVERSVVLLEVPERPGVKVRISPNITQQQMKNWRKNAGEDTRNGLDATKFACSVIAHTTVGLEIDGEEVLDEETLNAMKLRDLRIICEDMGIESDEMSKTQMIAAIIEASEK